MQRRTASFVAVALALLSLVATSCGGDDGGGNGEVEPQIDTSELETDPGTVPETAETETGEAGGLGGKNAITIELAEQNDSGQQGRATLTRIDGKTEVTVELFDGPEGPQPVHVHAGTCEELGDIAYPLNDLEHGRSSTRVDAPLEELVSGEKAINAHESAENIETYTACGEIEP